MSTGHRQAAAALYGHGDADREAVLGALPEADRAVLRRHLAEMAALGFERVPLDRAALDPAVADDADAQAPDGAARRVLQSASAHQLFGVLAAEPAGLAALFLECGPWPAERALVAMFEPERRARIDAVRKAGMTAAPALRAALLDALAADLPAAVPQARAARRGLALLTGWMPWAK
ncbi:hypothetical protein HH212_05170 [Massilia forsythiae]|uniref:Uncharacterized protein n=1 Tax=Massilia forsythiae TaxID=2728020 RepID=A0A7Z2ZRH0_9BURK|nr:hypothetical protein [Massilia forsythiae]QJD99487.1 hypothetical protein HH212_05170 [Massilia forsythiae]